MYEKELQQQIKWLNDSNGGKIPLSVLADDFFIDQPQYFELKKLFRDTEYHSRHWKWHQIVRMVLEPQETRKYMYDRLLSLLLKHRRSFQDYFVLKTQEGMYQLPNPLSDLNRIEILYQKYFEIYQDIKNHIHFDYPKKEYSGPIIKGKINWHDTIRNSSTEFPMMFVSSIRQKEFETPENILLVLCAEWMFRESSRLLQITFEEPLTEYKKNLLQSIIQRTKIILDNFPFTSVLNTSKRFWNLAYSDPRILDLEQKTRARLRHKLVRNQNYSKLLAWINDFRNLDISRITAKTPTRHILDSIENLDTVYEAWIFLEFVDFLHEKGVLINFKLGDNPNCQFEYNGTIVTFWYEKTFTQKEGHAWILEHKPDFTAMLDDEILAIFDAKNYSKTSSSYLSDSQNKMLAYMTNLDANFGALIYPNHPKNWDDLTHDERIQKTITYLKEKLPEETTSKIRTMARNVANLPWSQLPSEYLNILPPKPYHKFEYPFSNKKARYHFDQTLCLMRLSPLQSESSIKMKNDTLNLIFNEIVKRIPMTIKS